MNNLTQDWDSCPQYCPTCKHNSGDPIRLYTLDDYIGGGSHYWSLKCPICDEKFTFDTYRFKLERWNLSHIAPEKKCSCGCNAAGGGIHSNWCEKGKNQ